MTAASQRKAWLRPEAHLSDQTPMAEPHQKKPSHTSQGGEWGQKCRATPEKLSHTSQGGEWGLKKLAPPRSDASAVTSRLRAPLYCPRFISPQLRRPFSVAHFLSPIFHAPSLGPRPTFFSLDKLAETSNPKLPCLFPFPPLWLPTRSPTRRLLLSTAQPLAKRRWS